MPTATSETVVPVADATAMMTHFIEHIRDEHGISFDTGDEGARFFEQDGFRLEFKPQAQGLYVHIAAPHDGVLIFFKEEIVSHVSEIDATAASNIRWSGETAVVGALPANFKVLRVVRSRQIFEGMQRVTLAHEDVAALATGGIHLRLMMPLARGRTPVWPRMGENGVPVWPTGDDTLHARFITLYRVREADGEVDIDIVRHAGGLISDWAQQAEPGQTVGIMGPAGAARLPTSAGVFLAGDGTGLPAVARMMETAEPGASGDVVVAAPADCDLGAYLPATSLTVHAIDPASFEAEIVDCARRLTAPGQTAYGFFAGEFQNAQDLRALFKQDLGLGKGAQVSTAYWRRGVPGFGS